ncbi:MAG: AAA family ATPase [Planctomycetota bacterium]|jgi:MoxR-like ATPase
MAEEDAQARVDSFRKNVQKLGDEVHKEVVGQDETIHQVITCLLAGGHALIEGAPGLGKTLLVRTLSRALDLKFSRIQFTPDLMPADILGTNIVVEEEPGKRAFRFQKGPIFGNVLLADEINRATPKTQSALLEGMQEGGVTIAGIRHELPAPFFVLATQNPIEMEGTYPLPEAQLDRFLFKLEVRPPTVEGLVAIMERTTGPSKQTASAVLEREEVTVMQELVPQVPVASHVKRFVARLVAASHPDSPEAPQSVKRFVRYGASPRTGQAVLLAAKVRALCEGRFNVAFEDVETHLAPAFRHRLILNFEGEAEGIHNDDIVRDLSSAIPQLPEEVSSLV